MRLITLIYLFVFSASLVSAGTLKVEGVGEVVATPDRIVLDWTLSDQRKSASQAMSEIERNATRFLEQIADLGLKRDQVKTTDLQISPVFDYTPNTSPTLRGYRASTRIQITLVDFAKLEDVFSIGTRNGGTQMDGFRFDVSNRAQLQDQARVLAIKDAVAKANIYAGAAEVNVGAIVEISASETSRPMPMARMAMEASPNMIAVGDVTVTDRIQMIFEID